MQENLADNSINPYAPPATVLPADQKDPELTQLEEEASFALSLAFWSIPGALGCGMLGFGLGYVAHEAAKVAQARVAASQHAGGRLEQQAQQAKILAQVGMAISAVCMLLLLLLATVLFLH